VSITISNRGNALTRWSLPNVPALSCERQREREARPTSSSASTPCWAAGERGSEFAVAGRSVWLSILEEAGSRGSSGNAARKEAGRDVASLKRGDPEARSLERSSESWAGKHCRGRRAEKTRVLQGRRSPKPVARPSPWYFTTGERKRTQPSLSQSRPHAGRWKRRRLVLETSGGKRSEADGL
jgi:hypothetical protein